LYIIYLTLPERREKVNFQQALFISAVALLDLVAAECDVVALNAGTDGKGNILAIGSVLSGQREVCDPRAGDYTFVMVVARGGIPLPGGQITPGFPGYSSYASYMIIDNNYMLLGVHLPNGDCNSPYSRGQLSCGCYDDSIFHRRRQPFLSISMRK
jgi:hypothetical protein